MLSAKEELYALYAEKEKRILERNFLHYFIECWKQIEPDVPLRRSWYIDAICEHLQAVEDGQITRLIINQPPRTAKSSLVSVTYPTWGWTHKPNRRYIFYSYSFEKLGVGFSVKRRNIISSNWYQSKWGSKFALSIDQNQKWNFTNSANGHMIVVSGATGLGGNCLILDDPISEEESRSSKEREERNKFIRQTLMTRLDNKVTDPIIIVMQRLHDKDITGDLLSTGGWTHLSLEAEQEGSPQKVYFPISKKTVERQVGDLLSPELLPLETLRRLRDQELGALSYAGQYQQRPAPLAGNIVSPDWFKWYDPHTNIRSLMEEVIISVDTATSATGRSAEVAIQAWGMLGTRSYLLGKSTKRRNFAETKAAIRQFMALYMGDFVLIEGKSTGPAIIDELKGEFPLKAINPSGDKVGRLNACSVMFEVGFVFMPENHDGLDLQEKLCKAPNIAMDDVDACTQFLNWRRNRGASLSWMAKIAKDAKALDKAEAIDLKDEDTRKKLALEMMKEANKQVGLVPHEKRKPAFVYKPESQCRKCSSTNITIGGGSVKCLDCKAIIPREKV